MSHNLVQLVQRHNVRAKDARAKDARAKDATDDDNALERLKVIMHERREISPDDIRIIARTLHEPEAAVYGVATYYADLGMQRRGRKRVKVCKGTACFAACGDASVGWMEAALELPVGSTSEDGAISLETVYCLGLCHAGPSVEVEGQVYGGLTAAGATAIGTALRAGTTPIATPITPTFIADSCPPIVLERLSLNIDATQLETARAHGAFAGLTKALRELTPNGVLDAVERAQLRGRGGAGFPTATKWRMTAQHARDADAAYVVCNADEGDPGSYIDKHLMERDPFAVIEGMLLAGYAIGATHGYMYVRSEYPASAPSLRRAVEQARAAGLVGQRILDSEFSFDIDVVEGAGSYVCGEETALLRSLEGLRGMVSARPPYPAVKGLFEKPTVVNNVETLVNIGWIVRNGGASYAALGHNKSRGTKAVCLNERFNRAGIFEVPFGVTLRRILEDLGGGLKTGRPIKAVQVGGPLGGILPNSLLDTPLGFDELDSVGALLGHGGVVAWDDAVDVRDIAVHLFEFCAAESCGKCFPCRIGGQRGLELAQRLIAPVSRDALNADVALLTELCETMKLGSLCAHGGAIPIPIASLMYHFRAEMTAGAS